MDKLSKTNIKHVNDEGETSDVSGVDDIRTWGIQKDKREWFLAGEKKNIGAELVMARRAG